MRKRVLSCLAISALLLGGCSPERDAAPRSQSTEKGPAEPAQLRRDAACNAAFPSPGPGTEIRYSLVQNNGSVLPVTLLDKIVSVEGDVVRVEQAMEMTAGEKTPSVSPYERQSVVFWRSVGAPGASRRVYRYSEADLSRRLKALKPGQSLKTAVVESSEFEKAGARTIEGSHSVTFLGCGDVEIDGRQETAKVFQVQSIGRSYRANAAPADREAVVKTNNIIWISARDGWVLKDVTAEGQATAKAIRRAS